MDLSPLNKIVNPYGAATLEDFDTSDVQEGQRIKGNSNRQFVRFYNKSYSEIRATEVSVNERTGETRVLKTGAFPVTKEFVEIITPGDKNTVDQPAETFHKKEHFRHYKAFRDGRTAPLGKSLDECTYVSSSVGLELKYLGCHTEEQLADAADILCGQIADGFSLREFARASCKANIDVKNTSQVLILSKELEDARKLMADMKSQLDTLQRGQEAQEVAKKGLDDQEKLKKQR